MKSLLHICVAVALSVLACGCESMQPANYSNYGDNTFALRKLEGAKVRVTAMNDLSKFDAGCRMVGPIKTAGNRSVADFIKDALNDEFKFAGIYSDDPSATQLTTTLNTVNFSSMTNLMKGYWTFSLQTNNAASGKTLTTSSRYDFESGFDAMTACGNTSNALTPAVQRLINKVVTDPSFPALIGRP